MVVLETAFFFFFTADGLVGAQSILRNAFPLTQNGFANGALIPKLYSACSFADTMLSLGNFGETSASCP